MRLEFRTEHMLRGGPPVYDPGGIPQDRPYQPFDHPLASRPDRPPALPIPGPDRVLDLGCGASKEPGALGLDVAHVPGVDLQCDLFGGIPIRDHSVDLVWAHQFLEHVPHRLGSRTDDGLFEVLGEVHRILRKGGLLRLDVPHAHYAGAYWDPLSTSRSTRTPRFRLPPRTTTRRTPIARSSSTSRPWGARASIPWCGRVSHLDARRRTVLGSCVPLRSRGTTFSS